MSRKPRASLARGGIASGSFLGLFRALGSDWPAWGVLWSPRAVPSVFPSFPAPWDRAPTNAVALNREAKKNHKA